MAIKQTKFPNSRYGWHLWYVNRYNKTLSPAAAFLAMAYLFHHLAHEDEEPDNLKESKCTKELLSPVVAPNVGVAKRLEVANA